MEGQKTRFTSLFALRAWRAVMAIACAWCGFAMYHELSRTEKRFGTYVYGGIRPQEVFLIGVLMAASGLGFWRAHRAIRARS